MSVQYVDVYSPEMAQHAEVVSLLFRGDVPLPVITMNAEPRFAGGISFEMISEELEQMGLTPVGGA